MPNIWEKAISILRENLNSSLSYIMTTVPNQKEGNEKNNKVFHLRLRRLRGQVIKLQKNYEERFPHVV